MGVRLSIAPSALVSGELVVSGPGFHYLRRVHRLGAGEKVVLFDGRGHEADATIIAVDDAAQTLTVAAGAPRAGVGGHVGPITLLVALLKGDKLELVVQKATELGVTAIVPVRCARSVVHLDARRGAERARRWQKIAEEAARQSGRSSIPAVSPPLALLEAARATPSEACRIVLHVGDDLAAKAVPLGQVLDGAAAPSGVVLAVGPEGGLTADEVQTLSALGFHVARFGPRVLRAETAAIAAIVAAGLIVGDLRGADGG